MQIFSINKVLSFLDLEQKKKSLVLIILMFFASIAELLGLGAVILILNLFFELQNNLNLPFGIRLNINFESINSVLILLATIFTAKFLILILVSFLESDFMADLRQKTSIKLFENFLNRDASNLLKKNSSEYLRNFTEEINQTNTFYHSLIKLILDLIIFSFFIIFLISYNPFISIFVIFFFTLLGFFYLIFIKDKIVSWSLTGLKNRKKRIQFINESFLAIKFIKILSTENFFLKKFKIQNFSLKKIGFRMMFLNSLPRNLIEYILFLSIILLIFFANNKLSNIEIIQTLTIYTLVSFRLIPIINRTIVNFQNIRFTQPSFEKLFIELNQPIIIKKKRKDVSLIKFDKNLQIFIKKFKYENKTFDLFKSIKLDIKKNDKIGIIGPSGAGKSTLIDIICGFQKLKEGFVKSDGKSIFSNLEGWQKNIGYIPQNIVVLNQSLKDNILFGKNSDNFSDKKIINILKLVNLEYFLKKLPNGINQIIKQDGLNLSGGEKQRIGIARALINNPKIIILDEATSGLDSFTESKVLSTINKIKKTIIIVSHRINTLKFCNKIYSINNKTLKYINKSQLI